MVRDYSTPVKMRVTLSASSYKTAVSIDFGQFTIGVTELGWVHEYSEIDPTREQFF